MSELTLDEARRVGLAHGMIALDENHAAELCPFVERAYRESWMGGWADAWRKRKADADVLRAHRQRKGGAA